MKNNCYQSTYLTSIFILIFFNLAACASEPEKKEEPTPRPPVEYTLQADRSKLEELRKEIPTEKKKENDEIAYILQLMGDTNKHPNQVREDYNKALRKKREKFDRDMKKERDEFTKAEKSKRDSFTKALEEERKELSSNKMLKSDEKRKRYDELENKRREFFSEEREKRGDFESNIREKRHDFEDYARSKTNEFNQEHRAYTKRYDDYKKQSKPQNANNPQLNEIKELEQIPKTPGEKIGPGE